MEAHLVGDGVPDVLAPRVEAVGLDVLDRFLDAGVVHDERGLERLGERLEGLDSGLRRAGLLDLAGGNGDGRAPRRIGLLLRVGGGGERDSCGDDCSAEQMHDDSPSSVNRSSRESEFPLYHTLLIWQAKGSYLTVRPLYLLCF